MRKKKSLAWLHVVGMFCFLWLVSACNQHELDEYGGYYDKELQQYVYVRPGITSSAQNALGVTVPEHGKRQSFTAAIVRSEDPTSIWVSLDDRQSYMLLAQRMSRNYRNDEMKQLRIILKYVKPDAVTFRQKHIKAKWLAHVQGSLDKFFAGKEATVTAEYLKPGVLKGEVFVRLNDKMVNLSLWMISEGLSGYFKEFTPNPDEALFLDYQNKAELRRKGIWQ